MPEQFTSALSKIGGLLALLKFASIALKEYHRVRFEKDFCKFSGKISYSIQKSDSLIEQSPVNFRELFTYKNLFQVLKQTADEDSPINIREDVEAMKSTIDELVNRNEHLLTRIDDLVNRNNELSDRINGFDRNMSDVNSKVRTLEKKVR